MKTVLPSLLHAAAARHAAAMADHGPVPNGTQTISQFHQHRAGVLRPMTPPGTRRVRTGPPAGPAERFEHALHDAIDEVERGGADHLRQWLDNSDNDPLRQDTLLEELGERHPDARGTADALRGRLERDHGEAIRAGKDSQNGCAALVDQLARPAHGGAEGPGEIRESLQRLLGGWNGGASVAEGAHALADFFAAKGAGGTLASRMDTARRAVAADPALRRADAGGARLWMSLRQAASFSLLHACLEHGAGLHAQLARTGLLERGASAERAGVGLLAAGKTGEPGELAARVGVRGGGGEAASRLLAATVRQLPLSLWPSPEARGALLAALDGAGRATAGPDGPAARLERRLRTVQGAAHA